ncbi:MAG: MFS transporter, partial [Gammaproteobacteria bacterium]|nr:MFS transporter [Gammaproteobacteria bacterium]
MSHTTHVTADEDRIPFLHKVVYGLGAFVNNLLASSGNMFIVLNLGFGINPALVGVVTGFVPRMFDAFTDPMMGYASDKTRTRWGRRRPYIFLGAITAGLVLIMLWQLPDGKSDAFYLWYLLAGLLVFLIAHTAFATPWIALGYELTPDYHERTRLMGVQNFIGQVPWMIAPYYLFFMQNEEWFGDMKEGAAALAIILGVTVIIIGVLPALLLRERVASAPENADATTLGDVFRDFFVGIVTTLKVVPFLKLCVATFLIFNGFMLIASFQSYVLIYYVFQGDTDAGSQWLGHVGLLGALSTLVIIPIVTWLGTKIGKRRALIAAIAVSMVGYASKWVLYTPDMPMLMLIPAPLQAFGLGALFTIMPAMVADVVDLDELKTHERREGMYASIYWWVVKLGMAAALAGSGFLLNWTGFNVDLGANQTAEALIQMRLADAFFPAATSAIAI